MVDPAACEKLDAALAGTANAPKLLKGPEGLRTLAAMDGPDVVLNAVVGIAGCRPLWLQSKADMIWPLPTRKAL